MTQQGVRLTLPKEVKQEELEYIEGRREAVGIAPIQGEQDGDAPPLVGMSLSGGGIRSATFSLGILQALSSKRALRLVDYLSTVSGGGYIGSCLTSLMTHQTDEHGEPIWDASESNLSDNMPLRDRRHIHHLRKHGDFLLLGRGVVRRDVMRSIGVLVLGLSSTVLIYVLLQVALSSLIIAQTTAFAGAAYWSEMRDAEFSRPVVASGNLVLTGTGIASDGINVSTTLRTERSTSSWPGLATVWRRMISPQEDGSPFDANRLSLVALFVIGSTVTVVAGLCFAREALAGANAYRPTTGVTANDRQQITQLQLYSVVHIVMGIVLPLAYALLRSPATVQTEHGSSLAGLLFHPAYFAGVLFASGVFYAWNAFFENQFWSNKLRSLFGAFYGFALYALIFSIVCIAIAIITWWAISGDMWVWLAGSGVASMLLTRLLARQSINRDEGSSLMEFLSAVVMHIGLILAVFVFLASTFILCTTVLVAVCNVTGIVSGLVCAVMALALFGIAGYFINLNRIGLHYFYRDRLADAYLMTEDNAGRGLEVIRDSTGLKLTQLGDHPDGKNSTPYHLIVCALNLAGSRDLSRRDRKSDHFLFSRKFCGSTTTGYVRTERYRGGETQLNTAMTISGAAVSSAMGFYTSLAQSFATTLFNLRLGFWLLNPRFYDSEEGQSYFASDVDRPRREQSPRSWNDVSPTLKRMRKLTAGTSVDRTGQAAKLHDSGFTFWPWFLFLEVAALTHSDSPLINLSDGGHTGDNIGLYALMQRRCKLIIACDGEADPNYSFGSLTNAVRQIFVDEDVKVDIDLDDIRPKNESNEADKRSNRFAEQHYLIGRITYPESPGKGNEGWILYLKSSLAKSNLPIAVKSYAATHRHFPHDTTVDQIFKDDQFEAYRMLGEHIAATTLGMAVGQDQEDSDVTAERLIEWCEEQFNSDSQANE